MKSVILNTYDVLGGAAIATYRLHCGLRALGQDSRMVVSHKISDDHSVIKVRPLSRFQKMKTYFCRRRDAQVTWHCMTRSNKYFSPASCPDVLVSEINRLNPKLVHLFWVADGFMKIETLRELGRPIVWTLHDMWPFTGGCHYDGQCGRYRQSCGSCPILGAVREHDLSRDIWKRKQKSWRGIPLVVVATSRWMAEMAQSSSLFSDRRIEVIPNGIDTDIYKPADKKFARSICNLPENKQLILFSAFNALSDERKGSKFLVQAINEMERNGWGDKIELIVLGTSVPELPLVTRIKVHYLGNQHEDIGRVLLYSAADAVIAPSMQENLSNTVMESLACGTPVIAFNIGGMPDMIDHQGNGYLACPFEPGDLARGTEWVIENEARHAELSLNARNTVLERYALKRVADRYLELYQSITAG